MFPQPIAKSIFYLFCLILLLMVCAKVVGLTRLSHTKSPFAVGSVVYIKNTPVYGTIDRSRNAFGEYRIRYLNANREFCEVYVRSNELETIDQ